MAYIFDTSNVSSVWSAHGHTFCGMGEYENGEKNYVGCLTCGAEYQLLALEDDPTRGVYLASDGSEPQDCTHDTHMVHGYPGERVCDCPESCEHCNHDCNCIRCDS